MPPASPQIAMIESVGLTATHDGEAALVVAIRFPNGGSTHLQVSSTVLKDIMHHGNIASIYDLIGLPWTVLHIDTIYFAH